MTQVAATKGNVFLDGIDAKGTWLAKFFAKVCTYGLAYAVIYMAIQTALPALRNQAIYSIAMIIVMGSPELMIGGLTVEAMEKFRENKALGSFLFVVAVLFLSIGVLTMFDIFVWHFADNSQGQQMLSLYRAVVVLLYSAVHGIVSKLDEQRQEQIQQQTQANDVLGLANKKRLEELCVDYTKLTEQVHNLHTQVHTQEEKLHTWVHIEQFNELSGRVSLMSNNVTEISQNILTITNNIYNTQPAPQATHGYTRDYTTHIDEIVDAQKALPEPTEGRYQEQATDTTKALAMPLLEVPGVSQKKIQAVLAAVLAGTKWRDLPGNYSKTNQPIREAYQAYLPELCR